MRMNFHHHLLMQIKMLRGGISHEQLSKRFGEITERNLARYAAGKRRLLEREISEIAKAFFIDPQVMAQQWGQSLALPVPTNDPLGYMQKQAFHCFLRHTHLQGVPPRPSPVTILRTKYADRLTRQTPPLWFGPQGSGNKDTPLGRERFARAYQMLTEAVHDGRLQRDIGALRGFSRQRARKLMMRAANVWAKSEGIDLPRDHSVPSKNDARLVKNLYAGLRFFAQQQFNRLALEESAVRCC
jgi:hypothetical protein